MGAATATTARCLRRRIKVRETATCTSRRAMPSSSNRSPIAPTVVSTPAGVAACCAPKEAANRWSNGRRGWCRSLKIVRSLESRVSGSTLNSKRHALDKGVNAMPWTTPPGAGATVYIWNGYSLAERDRRWNGVRANAANAGLDCIMIPLGNGIDARYMTQLRCSAMVLPSDGRAPIVIADRKSSNEWVPEPWQTGRESAEPMAEALLDLGMDKKRVGVGGLVGGSVSQ